jgi:hypothetical protein
VKDIEVQAQERQDPTNVLTFTTEINVIYKADETLPDGEETLVNNELAFLRVDGVNSIPFKYVEGVPPFVFDDMQRVTIVQGVRTSG